MCKQLKRAVSSNSSVPRRHVNELGAMFGSVQEDGEKLTQSYQNMLQAFPTVHPHE